MELILAPNDVELNNDRMELILAPNDVELNNDRMELILVPNNVELNNDWMELILAPNNVEFLLVFRNIMVKNFQPFKGGGGGGIFTLSTAKYRYAVHNFLNV